MSDMRDDPTRTETDMRADGDMRAGADMRTDNEMRTDKEMRDQQMRDNRRMADRGQRDAEGMRTNPEVMGRAEPVAVDDRDRQVNDPEPRPVGRIGGPGVGGRGDTREMDGSMWPDMGQFHNRFAQIQSDFIEDPKGAVQKAEKLMDEMLDHITRSMRDRMKSMHGVAEGKGTDTEHLRLIMRRYREFLDSFERQAA
jgi:hypothetical protein